MMRASKRSVFCGLVGAVALGCGGGAENVFGNNGGGGAAAAAGSSAHGGSTSAGGTLAGGDGGAPEANGGSGLITSAGGRGSGGAATSGGAASTSGGSTMNGTGGSLAGASSGGSSGGTNTTGPVLQSGSQAIPAFTMQPACEHVVFPTAFGAPASHLRVMVSLVHPGSSITHDASAVWAQAITASGMDVCVAEDDGNDGDHPRSRVDWLAFVEPDAATIGFVSGRQQLSGNATPTCSNVSVPSGVPETYNVQTSLYGGASDANHGTAVWIEGLSATEFRLCALLLRNADAPFANTAVDWAAYSPLISDEGFLAGEHDFDAWDDGTHCDTFATDCSGCENVQISVNHRRRTETDPSTLHGATLAWVEDFSASGDLTICVRETSAENGAHDSHLSVDWLVRKQND